MIGAAVVGADGRWAVALENKLDAGDHAIASVAAGRETTQAGDEVRVFIPSGFSGQEIVAYDRARNEREALLPSPVPSIEQDAATTARAEELANAASEKFTEIVPPKDAGKTAEAKPAPSPAPRAGIDIATPVAGWLERASQAYKDQVARKLAMPKDQSAPVEMAQNTEQPAAPQPEPEASPAAPAAPATDPLSAGVDAVRSWLKDASETYDRDIATPLSIPANPDATAATSPKEPAKEPAAKEEKPAETTIKEAKPPVDTSGGPNEAARKIQAERERAAKALREAEERDAARAAAEDQRQAEEAKRRKAEETAARARDAARAAAEQSRKEAEAKKIQDGLKRLEDAQRAEEERKQEAAAEAESEAKAKAKDKKLAAPAAPLPSERELSRDRSFADSQNDPGGKRLEFKVEGEDQDAEARDREDQAEPDRTERLRDQRVMEQREDRSMKRSGAKQKSARVGGWRSRNDNDSRYARSCRAGSLHRKSRKHMVYVVKPGDTLWAIANRHYRHGSRYNIIYRANQHRISDADLIRPCQRLVLPLRGKRRHG
jgi:nucleoid-associated protein YgaU